MNPIIIRDSSILIQQMVMNLKPNNYKLGQIITRICHYLKNIGFVYFFNVLRENNKIIDVYGNKACIRT